MLMINNVYMDQRKGKNRKIFLLLDQWNSYKNVEYRLHGFLHYVLCYEICS